MKLIYGAHATHFYTDKNLSHSESWTTGSFMALSVRLTHIRLLKETFGYLYVLLNKHKNIQII
jgi:hypothetical protein